jgi:hypothetical protein
MAREDNAVGKRIQAWAFEHHGDAMQAALAELTAGGQDVVLGDADLQLVATWMLNDRELAGGGTPAQRYARRDDIHADERDVARRIATARLGILRVISVQPGRWIELEELPDGEAMHVISHDVSRTVRPHDLLVGRLMDGPPAPSLWAPVAMLTRETDRELIDLLDARIKSLGLRDEPGALAAAMHAASREITVLLAPGLRRTGVHRRAASV